MTETELKSRCSELMKVSEGRGVNWQNATRHLPQDDHGLIVATLATQLGYNLRDVFNRAKTIDELERDHLAVLEENQRLQKLAESLK